MLYVYVLYAGLPYAICRIFDPEVQISAKNDIGNVLNGKHLII